MATARVERRLSAILAADVVGYSRLMERDEAGTFERLKRLRKDLIEPILARYGGRFVDLKGDGAIVEFGSVVSAVEAAVEIQRAMQAQDPDRPEGERIRYRIGINLGDVIIDGDTIYGDGVNVAARIESLCEPGGVWLSRSVYNQVKGKVDLALVPSGLHQVKNISEAVETFRVALDGVAPVTPRSIAVGPRAKRWVLPAASTLVALILAAGTWLFMADGPPPKEKPSVAVLPFTNMGGDEPTGRLADGLTEDVITDLAHFRDLDVIARNSVEVYKGKPVDIRQVGKTLDVRYVLEGSIQRQADRVRVTAQLIDAKTDVHVWSQRWDRPMQDVFAVQAELAEAAAAKLGGYSGTIVAADRDAAKRKRPQHLTAYDLYLLGVEAKNRWTKEGVEEAIRLHKQSLAADPKFARAWTGLAWALNTFRGFTDDTPELRQAALDAAKRAVELDPADAEAHAALGYITGDVVGDLTRAEAEFDIALHLNPNSADILSFYASWASSFGKAEKGADAADQARRLNPAMPVWALKNNRFAFFMVGRAEEALRMHERLPPENLSRNDYAWHGILLGAVGRIDEARAAVTEALVLYPDISIESYARKPGWTKVEEERLIDAMRKAGFPACANEKALRNRPDIKRLPECIAT
jgi:TolB-like protein/class 3 adenylate cyclase